jgi:hypothetical protein
MLDVLYLPESLSFPVLPQDLLLNVCISLDLPGPSHSFPGFSCISPESAYIFHGSASTLDLYLPQTSFYHFCICLYLPVTPLIVLYLHVCPQELLRYPMNLLVSVIGPCIYPGCLMPNFLVFSWISISPCIFL